MRPQVQLAIGILFAHLCAPRAARAGSDDDAERAGEEPELEATSQPRARPRLRAFAAGGASYGELYGIGLTAGRIEGGLVVDTSRRFAITFGAGHELGETAVGLSTGDVHLYSTFDLVFGRVRLGVGPELSYSWITRARSTSAGRNIDALGMGLRLHVGVDAVTLGEGRAIFVGLTAETQWLRGPRAFFDFDGGAVAWRLGAAGGLRF